MTMSTPANRGNLSGAGLRDPLQLGAGSRPQPLIRGIDSGNARRLLGEHAGEGNTDVAPMRRGPMLAAHARRNAGVQLPALQSLPEHVGRLDLSPCGTTAGERSDLVAPGCEIQQVTRLVDQEPMPHSLRDDEDVPGLERDDLGILDVVVQRDSDRSGDEIENLVAVDVALSTVGRGTGHVCLAHEASFDVGVTPIAAW